MTSPLKIRRQDAVKATGMARHFRVLAVVLVALVWAVRPAMASETPSYSYDALGRLIKVAHTGTINSTTTSCYGYDRADNHTNVTVSTTSDCTPSPATVSFSITDAAVREGGTLVFTVTKTGSASGTLAVDYASANGTALAGSDYTAQSGTLIFLSGDTSKAISVATIDDAIVEGDETVLLNLSNATAGSAITRAQGIGTINDNDSDCLGISFTVASNAAITEGANSDFTITKAGSTSYSCQVSYATVNGPAVGGAIGGSDFTATSGTLTFASGQTSQTVSVPTINDTIFENTETFSLALSGPDKSGTLGTASTATATINDNDACNGAVFTISSIGAVTEGANSVFTITKAGAASGTCTVDYGTSNGTAVAPGDYTATSGTLSFTSSKTSTSVSVPTINDAVVESPETLSMNLSNPTQSAALGAPSTGTGTINDNDGGGACTSVSFAMSDATAIEGSLLAFTVTKTGTAATSCSVNYATSDGTALALADYTAKSGTLSFVPGQTSQTVSVSTIDNQRINGTLRMYLNLTTTTLDSSISRSQGNGSIGPNGTKCTVNCTLSVDPAAPATTTSPPTDTSPPPPTSGG